MKDKGCITITNDFQKILDESRRKPNKIWVNRGCESYNRSIKSWLEENGMEMYSTHNEGKFIVAERFIRTKKSKTSVLENWYINKLDIANKMKYVDVKSSTYIHFGQKNNEKDSKFEVGDHEIISKCKNTNL